jgi:hypothetical protein
VTTRPWSTITLHKREAAVWTGDRHERQQATGGRGRRAAQSAGQGRQPRDKGAAALTAAPAVHQLLLGRIGLKNARRLGLRVNVNREPTHEELKVPLAGRGVVRIELD